MRSGAWGKRRARRVLAFRVLVGAATFGVTSGLPLAVSLLMLGSASASLRIRQPLDDALESCANAATAVCDQLRAPELQDYAWLLWLVPVVALALSIWRGRAIAEALDDHLVGSFNSDFLKPVGPPRSVADFAAPLPWADFQNEERVAAWQGLRALTSASSMAMDDLPFAWGLVAGRPGGGKTRMVEEWARRLRAGEADPGARPAGRVRAWIRRATWRRPRAGEPWHVGHLPAIVDKAQLRSWRPGRPTLLILDDPIAGASGAWLQELHARRDRWRFPVRLAIVNQSVPIDLPLRAGRDGEPRWVARSDAPPMPVPPGIFAARSRLTKEDVRALLSRCSMAGDAVPRRVLYSEGRIEPFLEATGGNPLLVELGFHWVRQGKDPEAITRERLFEDRAESVLRGFEAAGIDRRTPGKLYAMAAATLAGPHAQARPILDYFDVELPHGDALGKLVPGDIFDPYEELPAILPHPIGDAVVRAIVQPATPPRSKDSAAPDAARIVAAGFAANPAGWLRAARRVAGGDDVIAEAFASPPAIAADDSRTRAAVATAYMELGLFGRMPALEVGEALKTLLETTARDLLPGLLETLDAHFEELIARDDEERRLSLTGQETTPTQIDEDFEDPFHHFIHPPQLMAVGNILLWARTLTPARSVACREEVARRLARLLQAVDRRNSQLDYSIAESSFHAAPSKQVCEYLKGEDFAKILDVIIDATPTRYVSWPVMEYSKILFNSVANRKKELGYRWNLLKSRSPIARSSDEQWLGTLLQDWDERIMVSDDGLRRARYYLLSLLPFTIADFEGNGELLARIEEITSHPRSLKMAEMQRWRLQPLRYLAGHRTGTPECDAIMARMAAIMENPAANQDLDATFNYLLALRYRGVGDLRGSLESARQIDALVARGNWSLDVDIQLTRIFAWGAVVGHAKDDSALRKLALEKVDAIASLPVFVSDKRIAKARSTVWLEVVRDMTADMGFRRDAVNRLDAIIARTAFADDLGIAANIALGWQLLTCTLSRNPAACQYAVDHVEAIATRTPAHLGNLSLQQYRAHALQHLAEANRHNPSQREAAISRIEAIAADERFADDAEIADFLRTARASRETS